MTNQQKAELIALVEKGSKTTDVGYYYSACVIRRFGNGEICAEKWGFALIGKFGDPAIAYRKYTELHDLLPTSNPGCLQMCYAVAQLLGYDWKELVEMHYAHDDHSDRREDHVASFRSIVARNNPQPWAQSVLADAFNQFEDKLRNSLTIAG